MKLLDIDISIPYACYDVKVNYFTPRVSTAIEWLILNIAYKIANSIGTENELSYSVDKIYTEIFHIGAKGDSNFLIKPSLIRLKELGAIDLSEYENGLSDECDMDKIPISCIKLTETGKEMHNKGKIPGKENEEKVWSILNLYDEKTIKLFNNDLVEKNEFSNEMSGDILICDVEDISDDALSEYFPRSIIKETLNDLKNQKSSAFNWLKPETEISRIEMLDPSRIIYKKEKIQVDLNHSFCISKYSKDENLRKKIIEFISNENKTENEINIDFSNNEQSIETVTDIEGIRNINFQTRCYVDLVENIEKNEISFINAIYIKDTDILLDEINKFKNKVFVFYNSDERKIEFNDSIIIFTKDNIQLPSISNTLYVSKGNIIKFAKFILDRQTRQTEIFEINTDNKVIDIESIIINLARSIRLEDYKSIVLYLFCKKEKEFKESLSELLNNEYNLGEIYNIIKTIVNCCKKYDLKFVENEKEILKKTIFKKLSLLKDEKQALEFSKQFAGFNYYLKNDEKLAKEIINLFLKQNVNWHNVRVLHNVLDNFSINKSLEQFIKVNDSINNQFNDDILLDIIRESDFVNLGPNKGEWVEFEKKINEFIEIIKDIKNFLYSNSSFKSLNKNDTEETFKRNVRYFIQSSEVKKIDELNKRVKKYNEFKKHFKEILQKRKSIFKESTLDDFDKIINQSRELEIIDKNICLIRSCLGVYFDDKLSCFDCLVCFDTCSLMQNPTVLDEIARFDFGVIVSNKTMDELNGIKDDKKNMKQNDAKEKAQKTLKCIDKYRDEKWLKFEEIHEELLSKEYSLDNNAKSDLNKNDLMILSSALRYIDKQPVIISEDRGFRSIARSLHFSNVYSIEHWQHDMFSNLTERNK